MKDRYIKTSFKDGKYIIEKIEAFIYEPVMLEGKAVITAIGGNGRFKFLLNSIEYITQFNGKIARDDEGWQYNEGDRYYDYSGVKMNIDIEKEWSRLYNYHSDKNNYWKAISANIEV